MTHYDPHDYGLDDDPPPPRNVPVWLILAALALALFVALSFKADAADLLVMDADDGHTVARCQLPAQYSPSAVTLTCRRSDTLFLDGFE